MPAFVAAAPAAVGFLGKMKAALAALKFGKMAGAAGNAAKYSMGVPGATKQLSLNLGKEGAKRMSGDAIKAVAEENAKKLGIDKIRKGVMNKGLNMADDAGFVDRLKRGLLSGEGFSKNLGLPMNKDEILMTVAPDLLFGGLAAATTEGDLVDKAIAGVGSATGGIVGGVGARGLLGPKSGLGILGTEMVGGIVGDQVGYGAAQALIRAKNGGMTPQEQSYMAQEDAYRKQLYDQFLAENGLG